MFPDFFKRSLQYAKCSTLQMAPKYLMLAAWLTNYPTNATGPHETVAHMLFVCGGWSYCYTHYKVAQRALSLPGYYLPFAFSFASFTFPIDAVAIALMKYYGATGWGWSKRLATFVFGEANLVLALVVCRFLLELYRNLTTPDEVGRTQAPTICEGDQEDAKGKTHEIQPEGSAYGGSKLKLDLI
jgi:tellurite resistance protein TehA-like permease